MVSDEDLVGRLVDGYALALHELLQRYERPLSHFIYRHTGGRDVEDLYQDTWLRVVQHAARFDRRRRFSTWLFQIAVNLCRDWHRRPPPEAAELPESAAADDLATVAERLDAARLLATLPEAQREVLLLRYYQDLTEDEVAQILDIPKGTVKSRLHNALQKLASTVQEHP